MEMNNPVIIGDCQLYLGDCMDILPTLGKVDAVVTDPPYGIGKHLGGGTWGGNFAWNKEPPEYIKTLTDLAPKSIIWGGNYFQLPSVRGWLVWFKRDAPPTLGDAELAWSNIEMPTQVFDWSIAATNAERVDHPTQKPIQLMQWCLGFIPNAQTILDPFMGSGTTGVACAKMGRKFIGIEREPEYFKIACKRIEEAYAQPDLFVEPPKKAHQDELGL